MHMTAAAKPASGRLAQAIDETHQLKGPPMTAPFRAHRHNYDRNHRGSIGANVRPAIIEAPHGKEEPGVMVGNGDRVVLVLTRTDAYRIAKDIADVLTDQNTQAAE